MTPAVAVTYGTLTATRGATTASGSGSVVQRGFNDVDHRACVKVAKLDGRGGYAYASASKVVSQKRESIALRTPNTTSTSYVTLTATGRISGNLGGSNGAFASAKVCIDVAFRPDPCSGTRTLGTL